jgi:hypothetical protein
MQVSKAYAAAEAASVAVETAEDESKAGKSQDATAAGAAATLESAKVGITTVWFKKVCFCRNI